MDPARRHHYEKHSQLQAWTRKNKLAPQQQPTGDIGYIKRKSINIKTDVKAVSLQLSLYSSSPFSSNPLCKT